MSHLNNGDTDKRFQWLLDHGRQALMSLAVLSVRSLKVDWSTGRFTDWQQALLTEQLQLRQRAMSRFPDPDRWLWTDRSLQQASDWQSAVTKAALFPKDIDIVDACCGAGADLVALSAAHRTVAIDRDLGLLRLARSNVQSHGQHAEFVQGELPVVLGQLNGTGLHVDPDRRRGQARETRTTHAEAFSPPLSDLLSLGENARACIIKLAPATDLDDHEIDGWSRAWLGVGRECPQQLLMRGDLQWSVPPGERGALLVESMHEPFTGEERATIDCVDEPEAFLVEPHAALYAAGLTAAWAQQRSLCALPHPGSYFTGPAIEPSPWAQSFEVIEHMSWDERRVRKWLKAHDVGPVEVKTRQVPMDANQLQRQLSQPGDQTITCLLYRIGKSIRVAMARRA